jgi:hypothetical protein
VRAKDPVVTSATPSPSRALTAVTRRCTKLLDAFIDAVVSVEARAKAADDRLLADQRVCDQRIDEPNTVAHLRRVKRAGNRKIGHARQHAS